MIQDSRLQGPVDFDLHGRVGIRLVDAAPGDARAVAAQLGPLRSTLNREPDIVIRFVDRIAHASRLRYLGVDDAAFTDDAFLVLKSKHKVKARVMIPFQDIGGRCEIVCESGLPAVPLLIPILNLTALARGAVPLHASAFVCDGTGVLVTGWSKGGKTEALLAFMSRGAEYLGDEWIYLDPDTQRMFGIPQPIRLWDWHLRQLHQYRQRIGWGKRGRLRVLRAAAGVGRGLTEGSWPGMPARALDRVQALVQRQTHVDVAPERLFGPCGTAPRPMDRVFLLASAAGEEVRAEPIDTAEIARRMVYSVLYELESFMSYYHMFRFAFPGSTNDTIDTTEQRLRAALQRSLEGRPAHCIYHPYPMCIASLYDAMRPLL